MRKYYKTRICRDPKMKGLRKFNSAAVSGRRALDWAMRDLDARNEVESLRKLGVIRREAIA